MATSNAVELCREAVRFEGEVTLGIHSNVAGDENGYTDGHAWISVETNDHKYYFGLWPDGHPRAVDKREMCSDVRINMELGAIPLVSRFYRLTAAQTVRLNVIVNRPDVWRYTNTCAAWAAKVLQEVVGSSVSAVDYAIFSTPRELGRELKNLEMKNPTSPYTPRYGEFQEPSSLSSR